MKVLKIFLIIGLAFLLGAAGAAGAVGSLGNFASGVIDGVVGFFGGSNPIEKAPLINYILRNPKPFLSYLFNFTSILF